MAKILIFKQNFGRAFSTKIWTFTEKFRFLGILKKLKKSSDIKSLSLALKKTKLHFVLLFRLIGNNIYGLKRHYFPEKHCFLLDGIEYFFCFLLDGFPIRGNTL